MKPARLLYRFLIILVFVAAVSSCDKDKDAQPTGTGLVGRWDLYRTTGGFAGKTTEVAAGTEQLEFTADSVAHLYQKNVLVETRQYSVRHVASANGAQPTLVLYYTAPGAKFNTQTVETDGNDLTLSDTMADGFIYRYRRL